MLRICDDAACAGGNDIASGAVYNSLLSGPQPFPGWSSIRVAALDTGTTQHPSFRLIYWIDNRGPDPEELWIYASAADFSFDGGVGITIVDTFSTGVPPPDAQATLYGGSSNLLFDISNQLALTVPYLTSPCCGSTWSGFEHVGIDPNPYSLTVGLFISHGSPRGNTSRGHVDLVPEPALLLLMGSGLAGTMLARRRRTRLR